MTTPFLVESGFPPIENKDARILILGSMPSVKSLEQQQYYAHPRNTFWPIMSALFNIDITADYETRCKMLMAHHIAVWDAIKACHRLGSLDQNIDADSLIPNNFNSFFQNHPQIEHIFFNGIKAQQVFNRHVLPTLEQQQLSISRIRLPSTSPAHAAMTLQQKAAIWQHEIISDQSL